MNKKYIIAIIVTFLLIGNTFMFIRRRKLNRTRKSPVKSITTIKEYGKSVDWHAGKNLIAFGVLGKDNYYDVHTMNPDGSSEICITCEKENVPQRNNGNPAWHPSGNYIIYTAENEISRDDIRKYTIPGSGLNNNLWLATNDGSRFFQLTNYPFEQPLKAVIHPQFSHDGKKIFWAERVDKGDSFGGIWVLKIADFVEMDTPHLENIEIIKPREQEGFYESHAFSNDDKNLLFSGDLEKDQSPVGLDIYMYNLKTKKLSNLTNTFTDWDEHAHYSLDGTKIAWMSSTGLDIKYEDPPDKNWKKHLATELWIMDADGSNKKQLTHFNNPEFTDYLSRRVIVSDSTWAPDGKSLAVLVAYIKGFKMKSRIVMVELE